MIFVRHGEAEHNIAFQIEGPAAYRRHRDPPLTIKGREQATQCGTELAKKGITIIITSPLQRCIETASHICQGMNKYVPIFAMDDLIEEQGNGEICNQRKCLMNLTTQHTNVDFSMCNEPFAIWDVNSPREDATHVKIRVERCVSFCKDLFHDKTILFVTHHDAIRDTFGKSLQNCEWFIV